MKSLVNVVAITLDKESLSGADHEEESKGGKGKKKKKPTKN